MKKTLTLLLMLFVTFAKTYALTIPAGTFYFDNSLTKYDHVKFVYGSDSRNETYIISMTHDEGDRWKITFDHEVSDMYRYTFAETTLNDGFISNSFPNVKDNISNNRGEMRTATTSAEILVGGIFVPTSGNNWAQGGWSMILDTDAIYSGTLPVLHINTEGRIAITSKDNYVSATYYLDALGLDGYESIGSKDNPLPMQIRGRGNYTWTSFNKKPYRIKLESKASLLGMNKSKHFALLAHADDNLGFLRNTIGFKLSELLGLDYTPVQKPVEVIINDDYIGLYFLTETIRVANDRVDITEQADNITDPTSITGGWIVEIDNYDEPEQIKITEGNGDVIRVTYKSPEILSQAQRSYLTDQFNAIDDAIYASDKNSSIWQNLLDIDQLVRFYIVQECMDNAESFHGSCYIHKDIGNVSKWKFGPVWDFGNSYHRNNGQYIYENPPFGQNWIGEIAKFPAFQAYVAETWKSFYPSKYDEIISTIDNFATEIGVAAAYDARRWPSYGNADMNSRKNSFIDKFRNRTDWLAQQWGRGSAINDISIDTTHDIVVSPFVNGQAFITCKDAEIKAVALYDLAGRKHNLEISDNIVTTSTSPGIYLLNIVTTSTSHTIKIAIR